MHQENSVSNPVCWFVCLLFLWMIMYFQISLHPIKCKHWILQYNEYTTSFFSNLNWIDFWATSTQQSMKHVLQLPARMISTESPIPHWCLFHVDTCSCYKLVFSFPITKIANSAWLRGSSKTCISFVPMGVFNGTAGISGEAVLLHGSRVMIIFNARVEMS